MSLSASILASSQSLQAANRPSESEYRSVRNYLDSTAPLHYREQEFIQYKEDLITLRPGRDHAWLDRRIERALQVLHRPFPWLNVRNSEPCLIRVCCYSPPNPTISLITIHHRESSAPP